MSREEAENGRDNMEIDGCELQCPQGNAVLDANFLKVYYGNCFYLKNLCLVKFDFYFMLTDSLY